MSIPVAQETELSPAVSDDAGENIHESKAKGWALILALGGYPAVYRFSVLSGTGS